MTDVGIKINISYNYDVSKIANFDNITEEDYRYVYQTVIRCTKAGFAYDESENYITNITVNKKTN